MTTTMNAIPTKYASVRFRSRLEARWAAFFDALGWDWEYEPFDLEGYIPDFVLLFHEPLLVEIKPVVRWDEATAIRVASKVRNTSWSGEVLLCGVGLFSAGRSHERDLGMPCVGMLDERHENPLSKEPLAPGEAVLMRCIDCKRPSVQSKDGGYFCRVCGGNNNYPGDVLVFECDGQWHAPIDVWREATNDVQWKP